jgi:hypothetical protein
MVTGKVLSSMFDEIKSPLIYMRHNYHKVEGKIACGRKTVALLARTFDEFRHLASCLFV